MKKGNISTLDKLTTSFSKSLNNYVTIDKCKFLNDTGVIRSIYNLYIVMVRR